MRLAAAGDVVKIWLWAGVSLLLAALLTPPAYNGGKALAELARSKAFNDGLDGLGAWSEKAGMADFFLICWPLAALVLLLPLIEWLRLGGGEKPSGPGPWSLRLPYGAPTQSDHGQRLRRNGWWLVQGLTGFCLTLGIFLFIGYAMLKAGSFTWRPNAWVWKDGLPLDIVRALLLAGLLEVFFRCVVLGIFLRAMKPLAAILLAALLFGSVPYIIGAFQAVNFSDGEGLSGFALLAELVAGGNVASRFFITFLPWFGFGCVLGWARWRTASLALPTGLLAGWLLADRLFGKAAQPVAMPEWMARHLVADSLHQGFIPLLGVIAVGGFVHWITQAYVGFKKTPW